jgi:hypothetical protein
MPLTVEVKDEMLERTSRCVLVATENVGGDEPLHEAVAASFDDRVVFGRQIHLKGDAGIVEFVRRAAALLYLAAKEVIADRLCGPLYETIMFRRSPTVGWSSV